MEKERILGFGGPEESEGSEEIFRPEDEVWLKNPESFPGTFESLGECTGPHVVKATVRLDERQREEFGHPQGLVVKSCMTGDVVQSLLSGAFFSHKKTSEP